MPKRRLEEEFEKLGKIGQGSYGVVYKVRKRDTQDIRAIKKISLDGTINGFKEGIPSSSLREIAALKNLKHPNILDLYDIVHTRHNLFLVFEYLDQDLKKALEYTSNGFSEKVAKNYLWQLLKAISFCHSRRILHRDLKLQNLLVNKKGDIKLADFGLARTMTIPLRVYTKEVVTLWYRAPEILLGSEIYGPPVDIWSLGCIFYEMLTKKALFAGDSEIDQLFKIFKILGTPTDSQWSNLPDLPYYKTTFPSWPSQDLKSLIKGSEEGADLLAKMVTYDPSKRLSAQSAMKHSYFDELTKRPSLRNIQDPSSTQRV